jgi:hypothetical protein
MNGSRTEPRWDSYLGRVTYYLALLLVVTPAVDLVANVLPLQFGVVEWRYGTVGLLSGFLLTPVLGLLLASIAAASLHHSGVLRFLGVLNVLGGVVLLGVSTFWVLDMLEVRSNVPGDARATFDIGSIKAFGKNLTVALGLVWLGIANLRLARARRGAGRTRRGSEDAPPLVQRSSQA